MSTAGQAVVPKLRFPEFEGAWETKLLGDLFPKVRNGFVGTATPFYDEAGVPYLQGKNIKSGAIDPKGLIRVNSEFHEKQKKSQLKSGDLLMVQSGHVGECAVVTPSFQDSNCHALVVMSPTQKVRSEFIRDLFYGPAGRRQIYKIKTGNTIEHILTSDLKPLILNVPSLPEQKKIAAFLGVVDGKLAALREKEAALTRFKTGLMQALFSQTLRFTRDDGSAFPDWEEKRLGDFSDKNIRYSFTGGPFGSDLKQSHYTDQGVMVIQLQNIGDGVFVEKSNRVIFTSEEDADRLHASNIFPGEILISKMGDPVARACIVPNTHDRYVMCSDGIRFVVDEKLNNKQFVFQSLNTPSFRKTAIRRSIGSTRKRISLGDLQDILLPAPHPEEQQKIADALSAMDAKIAAVGEQITRLDTFKKGLLQQMFV